MSLEISQNFITNTDLLKILIASAGFSKSDVVLDIGAGKGAVTDELAKVCGKVIAFELDTKLLDELKLVSETYSNIDVLVTDFLKYPLPQGEYKVFSNIPFSITSDIVNKLVFNSNPPKDCYLFVQKEAALRFLGIGEGKMISLLIKPFFEISIVHEFNKSDFSPKPSVDVVLLRIRKLDQTLVKAENIEEYRNFIVHVLIQQKPTLKLRLNRVFTSDQFYRLSKDLKFPPEIAANELTLDQWIGLFKYYLIGVSVEKKEFVKTSGDSYFASKKNISGPSRTKIRK